MGRLIRDSQMAWLAGFTDGDGNIDIQLRGSAIVVRISWFQTERNNLVLGEIQDYLKTNLLINSYFEPKAQLNNIHGKKSHISRLRVYAKADSKLILESIAPYSIVKAPVIAKALRLLDSKMAYRGLPVDWDYIAGFTDSDGHISTTIDKRFNAEYKQHLVGWTQEDNASYVLYEIEEFLKTKNICCSNILITNPEFPSSLTRQLRLGQKFSREVLEEISPWLIVKGRVAKEAIVYLRKVEEEKVKYGRNYRAKKLRKEASECLAI